MQSQMIAHDNLSIETAAAVSVARPVELHSLDNPALALTNMRTELAATPREVAEAFDRRLLPFISEKYRISRSLNDYVVVPITIMPSDLPNRNLVAFPFARLSEFSAEMKCIAYETWRYCPTHANHVNADHERAKGLVLDVGMRKMRNARGDLWRVEVLGAFDRSKDPKLVNRILNGEVTSYSMGAYVTGYECSICGAATKRPSEPSCMHIPANRSKLTTVSVQGKPVLAYWNVQQFCGFEVSALEPDVPGGGLGAFPSTDGTKEILFS